MTTSNPRGHRIEPERLGPLGDRPLLETSSAGSPTDLFPGASAFLSARHQRRRGEQWEVASPLAGLLLRPEEPVLYVAHAMQVPPPLHALALGALALPFHQVMLVFTDRRLIEVLLDVRGKTAGTRLRSYPWASVRDLKLGFTKLALEPAHGKKQAWKIPLRGDRKLLKLLLPKLKMRLMQEGAGTAQPVPLWHCPKCGGTVAADPRSCDACRTTFLSPRLATLLSLAFPGAGLLYSGHPFLALADFLGEAMLYLIFLLMVLQAEPGSLGAAIGFGAFLFLLTKLESVHVSRILTARSQPETEARRAGYGRFALVGGLVSLLLIGGPLPLAGAARAVVDHDLDVAAGDSPWRGSRDAADWEAFSDDTNARSQWHHPSGLRLTLLAYPQGILDDMTTFRDDLRLDLKRRGVTLVKDDEDVPSPFKGFRVVGRKQAGDKGSILLINYFVLDEPNEDVHQAVTAVNEKDGEMAEGLVRDFLAHARWIGPTPPKRAIVARQP